MMIFSTLIIMASSSWFSAWMAIEINLISFISLILNLNKPSSIEASIIYFLIQSMSSIIFLVSIIIFMYKLNINNNLFKYTEKSIILSLMMKMGAAPFHFWMPIMVIGLNWINTYLLMTWQKLGPLIILSFNMNNYIINIFIILSSITGSLGGLNQTSLKKIMAFSSINQMSWILMSLNISKYLMKIYFFFYMIILMNIILIFYWMKLTQLSQLFNLKSLNKFMLLNMFFNIFSMGGLPPFIGFFPKMMIIMNSKFLLIIIMILFTLITLSYYLRMMYFILMLSNLKLNYIYTMTMNYKIMMISSFFSHLFLMFMFFY